MFHMGERKTRGKNVRVEKEERGIWGSMLLIKKLFRIPGRSGFSPSTPQWSGLLCKEMATGAQQSTTYCNVCGVWCANVTLFKARCQRMSGSM